MKKISFKAVFITVFFLLMGYASVTPAFGAVDKLDKAIRDVSDYINKRIPPKTKVVFLNIKSDWPDLSDYILSGLSENGVNDGVFSVIDRQQIDVIRQELNFQWSGEVSDKSAQQIGEMLGAQTIVSGTVSKIGSVYRIQARAIEVQTAAVQGQFSLNVDNKGLIVSLTKKVVPAAASPVIAAAKTGGASPQTPAAAPAVQPAAQPTAQGGAQDKPQVQTVFSFPLIGLWKVTGRDSVNWTANMVIDEIDNDRFSGYFEWRGGIDFGGREYFRGVYDFKDKKVIIQGYRLTNAHGLVLGRYEAYLTKNGDFESGTWSGGGVWEAKWQK